MAGRGRAARGRTGRYSSSSGDAAQGEHARPASTAHILPHVVPYPAGDGRGCTPHGRPARPAAGVRA
eukprot:1326731-Prymnesium_polylepis.1